MALFFSCLMVGLVVIAVWKRNYKKETIDNILSEGNKKEWLRFLFPMGLWIYDLLSKKQPAQNEEEREWANAESTLSGRVKLIISKLKENIL